MICPNCNTNDPKVYVGFSDVECVNRQCRHFSGPNYAEGLFVTLPNTDRTLDFVEQWDALANLGNVHGVYRFSEDNWLLLLELAPDAGPRWAAAYYSPDIHGGTDRTEAMGSTPQEAFEELWKFQSPAVYSILKEKGILVGV